jgi:hypothetical protein
LPLPMQAVSRDLSWSAAAACCWWPLQKVNMARQARSGSASMLVCPGLLLSCGRHCHCGRSPHHAQQPQLHQQQMRLVGVSPWEWVSHCAVSRTRLLFHPPSTAAAVRSHASPRHGCCCSQRCAAPHLLQHSRRVTLGWLHSCGCCCHWTAGDCQQLLAVASCCQAQQPTVVLSRCCQCACCPWVTAHAALLPPLLSPHPAAPQC